MEINKPMTTRNMLASTLTDYRNIRKANGGHMFAGARAGS